MAEDLGYYEVKGKDLKCLVCGYDKFYEREAQLNTSLATMFNVDAFNPSGTCVICGDCGYIHWFFPR
jgi:uncharacterized protein